MTARELDEIEAYFKHPTAFLAVGNHGYEAKRHGLRLCREVRSLKERIAKLTALKDSVRVECERWDEPDDDLGLSSVATRQARRKEKPQ